MNIDLAQAILERLATFGLREVVLCPGARNAPFVELLSTNTFFNTSSFYDERSAAFFALGRTKREQSPVAVITTSGTAVAELLPATIEAWHSHLPLVLISADRPRSLRGTGAPQTIEQANLFGNFVEKSWDIESVSEIEDFKMGQNPIHINVCFDEPLIDKKAEDFTPQTAELSQVVKFSACDTAGVFDKTLIVVGALREGTRKKVTDQLVKLNLPIFAEAASGLRGVEQLQSQLIKAGEKQVAKLLHTKQVQSIIRIGDVPLGRFWRDLDQMYLPVLNFSEKSFPGLSCAELYQMNLEQLNLDDLEFMEWNFHPLVEKDGELGEKISGFLNDLPNSEPGIFNQISETIEDTDFLYLGNSLPIRLWDLVCSSPRGFSSNRGANGIDGQLASALGEMKPDSKNWVILGDLTTLYDFSALWVSDYLRKHNIEVNLVVVNNSGGQIFSRIFDNTLFRNQHSLNFEHFAKAWNWGYSKLDKKWENPGWKGLQLIEVVPDAEATQIFWQGYDNLWID